MSYSLLAHSKWKKQALVQHDAQQAAYLYNITPLQMVPNYIYSGNVKATYTLVGMEYTVDPNEWVTEYDSPKRFSTIDALIGFVTA